MSPGSSTVPLLVEVIAYAPTQFFHCQHCEFVWQDIGLGQKLRADQLDSSLPADLIRDYADLSDWVRNLVNRYGDRIAVKVIDAVSLEGVWKSLRYGARRYPAVIIGGKTVRPTGDLAAAEAVLQQSLTPAGAG